MKSDDFVHSLLSAERLSIAQLRSVSFGSIPEVDDVVGLRKYRSLIWKLLLGFVPLEKNGRLAHLLSQRQQYRTFLAELDRPILERIYNDQKIVDRQAQNFEHDNNVSSQLHIRQELHLDGQTTTVPEGWDPLSPYPKSRVDVEVDIADVASNLIAEFGNAATSPSISSPTIAASEILEADSVLRSEIEKDVKRIQPENEWFEDVRRHEAMKRILYVYAKLNRGVGYVQAMHELVGVVYYAFVNDCLSPEEEEQFGIRQPGIYISPERRIEDAEADTFFCFMALMSEIRELFIPAHDRGDLGVHGVLTRFQRLLRSREPLVSRKFVEMGLEPSYYAIRWITTLLARDLEFEHVLILWDSLLADPARFAFLLHFCVGMIRSKRDVLLASDFNVALKLLQNYPCDDFLTLMSLSMEVRAEDNADAQSRGVQHFGGLWHTPTSMLAQSPPPKKKSDLQYGNSEESSNAVSQLQAFGNMLRRPPQENMAPFVSGFNKFFKLSSKKQ